MVPVVKIARLMDYDEGSLLVLAADFAVGRGQARQDGDGFAWWLDEHEEVVGFSYEGLEQERTGQRDEDDFSLYYFRITVPQLRLAAATVAEVIDSARRFFIIEGHRSPVREASARARAAAGAVDQCEALQEWLFLYHVHGDIEGLFGAGCALLELGAPAQAAEALRKFIDLRPHDAWAHRYLGCAYLSLGKIDTARRQWQAAIDCEKKSGGDTGANRLLKSLASACDPACVKVCQGRSAGLSG